MKQYTFDINGHQVEAEYEETFIEEVVEKTSHYRIFGSTSCCWKIHSCGLV